MVERNGPEFQCLKGNGWNSNVQKERARNPMLERIGPEFQCLKEKGWNSNV